MEQQLYAEFNQLTLKQKLNMMLEDLQNAESLGELWADSNVDPSLLSKSFDDVTMVFDTVTGAVDVVSDLLNDKGQPMFEWQMTPKTGEVVEISRDQAGKSEKTVNKDVDPIELTSHTAQSASTTVFPHVPTSGVSLSQLMQDPTVLSLEWQEAEAQRDIAFKIMYFFIALVIVTFLTLYAYFTIVQKSEA